MLKCRLKEIRMREFMYSKQEFARFLKVPYSTYNGWETEFSNPKLEQAFDVAEKLNKKITDIWYLVKN